MASVYKSVSKTGSKDFKDDDGGKKNKQRVLVLTSRGVTYRFVCFLYFGLSFFLELRIDNWSQKIDIATSSKT